MAAVAGGALVGGTALSAFGQIESGQAQSKTDLFNAAIAKQNAQLATNQANTTIQIGDQDVSNQEMENAAKYGATKAHQGASGITVNSGSNADVLSGEKEVGQLDAMNVRSNAIRKAYNYQVQSTDYAEKAVLDTTASKNATTASEIGAGGTTLSGASKFAMLEGSSSSDPYTSLQNSRSLNLGD